eukprot:m.37118 g.37118  ORF g.37118 m.37118 type:complete len:233 (+) comp5817_c0_seq2:1130-1828(+)
MAPVQPAELAALDSAAAASPPRVQPPLPGSLKESPAHPAAPLPTLVSAQSSSSQASRPGKRKRQIQSMLNFARQQAAAGNASALALDEPDDGDWDVALDQQQANATDSVANGALEEQEDDDMNSAARVEHAALIVRPYVPVSSVGSAENRDSSEQETGQPNFKRFRKLQPVTAVRRLVPLIEAQHSYSRDATEAMERGRAAELKKAKKKALGDEQFAASTAKAKARPKPRRR